MTYERRIEPRSHRIAGLSGLSGRCESDRLITERRQDFLMSQQTLTIRLKHQYRFAKAPPGCTGRILNQYRLL